MTKGMKRFIVFGTCIGLGGNVVVAGAVAWFAGPMMVDQIEKFIASFNEKDEDYYV